MNHTAPIVTAIKAFNDNYIWAISHHNTQEIALVDPGDAEVCIAHLQKNSKILSTILITHHHSDHIGGIEKLKAFAKQKSWPLKVYGPTNDGIKQLDITLAENDSVTLPRLNCKFRVIDVPGHTHGHIAYFTQTEHENKNQGLLFCGDTLFSGGCGRVFEGTPAQMHHSLTKLVSLPSNTLIYCAHEYTQANLAFALAVDPDNKDLNIYAKQVAIKRQNNQSTIPSTIGLEQKINPFLRCHQSPVQNAAQTYYLQHVQQSNNHGGTEFNLHNDTEVFTQIRAWKNSF
ncbi:hydroxyacylglutathione hydrolase [Colwellia echini]|uniref:Hydroxyacylglutathione hydrolase n=1 Tax=Colwellia echini TaxID=1982103 RepID=A0ABY3MUD0_9GAMM|nr:hydroxyacylglutathione hydrolase [Colwellia echini]TYK64707.1 hydroxyacylglutathione hydrolase [Colwellia echini]